MLKADFTQQQINPPFNRWCDSGHEAPLFFKKNEDDLQESEVRFYKVTSKKICGIFCEKCLTIAVKMAKNKKENGEK